MLKFVGRRRLLQAAVLLTGIFMMVAGLLRGEALEILNKAIIVCMECIGIG